jgi:hypothetical protein
VSRECIDYLVSHSLSLRFTPRRRIRVSASRPMIDLALLILNDASHTISRRCHVEAYAWEVKVHHAHGRFLAAEDDRVLVD